MDFKMLGTVFAGAPRWLVELATPFNSQAARYAIERGGALKAGPSYMTAQYIAGYETPDDYTLRLLMKEPSPTYLHYLAGVGFIAIGAWTLIRA